MELNEKLGLLAEAIEVDAESLSADTILDEISEYDSMAKLSIIVMMEDEFDVKLTGDDVRGFKTVGDILKRMEK